MTKQPWNKNKSIGQKIKQRRTQLALTQADLARKINVQKQRIVELESESKRPSAQKLLQIADALDAPFLYFLTDCELNDVDEEILLVKYRGLNDKQKKLVIKFSELLTFYY